MTGTPDPCWQNVRRKFLTQCYMFSELQSSKKYMSKLASPNAPLGYGLCFLNLALDGFTNATQDSITKMYGGSFLSFPVLSLPTVSSLLTSLSSVLFIRSSEKKSESNSQHLLWLYLASILTMHSVHSCQLIVPQIEAEQKHLLWQAPH